MLAGESLKKIIFHFSFDSFHFSLLNAASLRQLKEVPRQMTNENVK